MNYDDILHKYLLYSIYYRLKSAAGPLTVDRNAGACAGRSGGVEHLPADPTKLKFLDFRKGPKTCKYRGNLGSHQPDELKKKRFVSQIKARNSSMTQNKKVTSNAMSFTLDVEKIWRGFASNGPMQTETSYFYIL